LLPSQFRGLLRQVAVTLAALVGALLTLCLLAFVWVLLTSKTPEPIRRTTERDRALPAKEIDGFRFHLETHGDPARPVIVVLHGGPGNDYRYLLPLRALSDQYYVIFYDQRGSGLSPRVSDDELTLDRFVADLDAIGRTFSPSEPILLIGHSWGAMLATAYLARYPERVSHAVLAEPGFLTPKLGDRFLGELDRRTKIGPAALSAALHAGARALKLPGASAEPDARIDHFVTDMSAYSGAGNPIAGYFCQQKMARAKLESWRLGARAMTTMLGQAVDEQDHVVLDLSVGVERFPREVLLIAGACNEIIGPEVQAQHRLLFQKARLEVIPNAGHTMFGERPDESLAIIRRYFAQAP